MGALQHMGVFALSSIISAASFTTSWFFCPASFGKGEGANEILARFYDSVNRKSGICYHDAFSASNHFELFLFQDREDIPAFMGTVPNIYSSILCEN